MLKNSILRFLLSAIIVFILWYFVHFEFTLISASDNSLEALGVFQTVFGVIYAIIAGFLLFEVLSNYDSLEGCIDDEVNELQDLRDLGNVMVEKEIIGRKFLSELADYVKVIISHEWSDMQKGITTQNADTTKELYEIYSVLLKAKPSQESEKMVLGIMFDKLTKVTTLRTRRVGHSVHRLSFRLNFLLGFMSVVLVLGVIAMPVDNVFISLFMTLSLFVSVYLLHRVIKDLDSPFIGIWKILPTQYVALSASMSGVSVDNMESDDVLCRIGLNNA